MCDELVARGRCTRSAGGGDDARGWPGLGDKDRQSGVSGEQGL